jgi:tRNA threonylcarbamoyladenosine biosynthesis protein TsaB
VALVLGIDTSTLVGSVALLDGDVLLGETTLRVRASHGESLLAVVDRAMADAGAKPEDLSLIAYAKGPGSFTGVRIGMATVKGIALAVGTPIVGVSSLRALAMHCQGAGGFVCPVTDARRGEVYGAAFAMDAESPREVLAQRASTAAALATDLAALPEGPLHLLGDGVDRFRADLTHRIGPRARVYATGLVPPRGAFVAILGAQAHASGLREELATAAPAYLRPADAEYRVPAR